MATTVENPFDTQQPKATNTGIVGGAINNTPTGQNATAQSLAQYNPMSDMSAQSYAPQTREVNQATETAAGQVTSLLANDNPLMQRARTLATQQMAQRGLVNSSMSQGAGVAAMVDRITPIAQQDAQTYSNRALANMDATNRAGEFNVSQNNQLFSQGLAIAANSFEAFKQREFTTVQNDLDRIQQTRIVTLQENGMDRRQAESIASAERQQAAAQAFQAAEARAAQAFQAQQAEADRSAAAAMENLRASNNAEAMRLADQIADANVPANFASTIALNTSNAINQVLTDPNLTPEAKPNAVQNIVDASNATLNWGSTFYNTPLPNVSTPTATPAPAPAPAPARAPTPAPTYTAVDPYDNNNRA